MLSSNCLNNKRHWNKHSIIITETYNRTSTFFQKIIIKCLKLKKSHKDLPETEILMRTIRVVNYLKVVKRSMETSLMMIGNIITSTDQCLES